MARIAAAELERLKVEVSLVRLIEDAGIVLRRQGKDWAACCPFHAEDTASLIVTPEKNLFHCFGCGAAGGPIDWVMKRNGVSFRHAVELLREGMPGIVEGVVKHSTVRALPPPVAFDADDQALLNQVVDYYHETLKQSPEALAYLQARGLSHPELVDRFKLGYANRTLGLRLPEKTRKAGAEIRARLERIGIYRDTGHEHFNGSLVVPVLDEHGNVVEIYGRKILDNLRAGTPKHLYLPGPHRGVWNLPGIAAAGGEIILCEALIDALTFWVAGFRNVTSCYGVEGFTEDHLAAFRRHNIRRVLIAFDRDEAGERGAARVADLAMAAGIECFRIQFPKGMDANDYAQKVTPAAKSLGVLIRKAAWLGKGETPPAAPMSELVTTAPIAEPESAPSPLAAETVPAAPPIAAKEEILPPPPSLPASPVPDAPQETPAEITEQEIVLRFGDRRWRVRGLPKNLAVGVLKVNLMVATEESFHVDTFDLYAARAREHFLVRAAAELHVPEQMLKGELGRVLLRLEQLQDAAVAKALEPQGPVVPAMTDKEREAALGLLRAPDLLARIAADFDSCGVVGEATNKLVGYLAATSRKLDRPLAVVIQSSSAAGKSALMDAVLAFMPEEETVRYSAMTGQSLFYMGETNLKHRILAIAEEQGAARAAYALKLLQSEGELTIASTGTDAAGNLVTQEYRVEGPTVLFMTTTAIDIDEELMNRCLVLSVDEGREQTRAIHARQRARRTLDGLMAKAAKDAIVALHRHAQLLLRPLAVVNPYADRLTFLDDRTRTRRDHEKYLSLIDTIALLHQHQRPVKTLPLGDRPLEYIEATLEDIATANNLAHDVLGRSLDELPPQTRRVLAEIVVQAKGKPAARFTRKELRDRTGWGDTQLKVHLARLVELEHLLVHRTGRGFEYELLYDGDGAITPHLSGLIDVSQLAVHRYDDERSGVNGAQSASGRGAVGGVSGAGRTVIPVTIPTMPRASADAAEPPPESRAIRRNGAAASYAQAAR
jgi:DNA primase catalytic core